MKRILLSLVLILLLSACDAKIGLFNSDVESTINRATLEPSKAGIAGQVFNTLGGSRVPLSNTVVRLATVYWNEEKTEGAFVIEGASSPSTYTDDNGVFIFTSLEPGDYVVVVGDMLGNNVIISNPDGSATIYTATMDQVTEVGVLDVELAP